MPRLRSTGLDIVVRGTRVTAEPDGTRVTRDSGSLITFSYRKIELCADTFFPTIDVVKRGTRVTEITDGTRVTREEE
jgi:hypothetical protein